MSSWTACAQGINYVQLLSSTFFILFNISTAIWACGFPSRMCESPYTILGVRKGCTREEVKHAYYRQAKQWHPDNNKTEFAAERFHKIQRAMKTLLDDVASPYASEAAAARSWQPSASQARASAYNQLKSRGGIPVTLAVCGAAIAASFVMFSIKWSQHEQMYPRRPRNLTFVKQKSKDLPNDAPPGTS